MTLSVSGAQALAWRLNRHLLDSPSGMPANEIVRRLCGVQAQLASAAELAVRVRRKRSSTREVAGALSAGALIKTWAMRGTLHLLHPQDGGAFLSLIAAARPWARPSWVRHFGVTPEQIDALRNAVDEALEGRALTREELTTAVTAKRGFEHMGEALRSGWGSLLKPLAWQGALCFGPSRGTRVSFARPQDVSRAWAGLPPVEEAAARATAAYLGVHGPASADAFGHWLAGGWFGKRQLRAWFAELGDRLVEVDIEGEPAYVLAEHADELAASRPSKSVRLLPAFDQWVLGPGTADGRVVPAARRSAVSRQAGWISPVVIVGGVVGGTWRIDDDRLTVEWFGETGKLPKTQLEKEGERLAASLGQTLRLQVARV